MYTQGESHRKSHPFLDTHTHTNTRICIHTRTDTHAYTHTHTHTHTHKHRHTHTHTHTRTQGYAHTQTHTHIHTHIMKVNFKIGYKLLAYAFVVKVMATVEEAKDNSESSHKFTPLPSFQDFLLQTDSSPYLKKNVHH